MSLRQRQTFLLKLLMDADLLQAFIAGRPANEFGLSQADWQNLHAIDKKSLQRKAMLLQRKRKRMTEADDR